MRKIELAAEDFMHDQKEFHNVDTRSRIASGDGYDRGKSVGSEVNLPPHSFKSGAAAKAGLLVGA